MNDLFKPKAQYLHRNFRYQKFPQTPRVPEAPYSGLIGRNYGATDEKKQNQAGSAGIGMLFGLGFVVYLMYSFTQLHDELKAQQ